MTEPPLALEVASGILIAYLVVASAKYAVAQWREGDGNMAVLYGAFTALIGGTLVLAGMGTISW